MNTKSNQVIERINSAVNAGIKIKFISEQSGITYFRIASVVNTKSYRTRTTFTDSEADKVNEVLDGIIKKIIK